MEPRKYKYWLVEENTIAIEQYLLLVSNLKELDSEFLPWSHAKAIVDSLVADKMIQISKQKYEQLRTKAVKFFGRTPIEYGFNCLKMTTKRAWLETTKGGHVVLIVKSWK